MEYIFTFYVAAQYLVSFLNADFLRQAGTGYFAVAAAVFAFASFVIWKEKKNWAGWLGPRYLQAGNPDVSGMVKVAVLFWLELFYLTAGFLLPHALYPELSMGKTDLYISLAAEVCMILLLFLSRFDIALAGEKKPPVWCWRILPVSTLMIVWVLQHHWNPFWPQNPWQWAQNMALVFLAELACNIGFRSYLAGREPAAKPRRAAGKNRNRMGGRLSTAIFACIVLIEPIDLPRVMRVHLNDTGSLLAAAIFVGQLACIAWFFMKKPVWARWLTERAGLMDPVSEDKFIDNVQTSFLILCMLFFGNILPYSLYMEGYSYKFEIAWMAYWAFVLWTNVFWSPIYSGLTGVKEMPPFFCRFPWLSFTGVILAVWNFPLPYDPMRCSVLLLSIFLLEGIIFLV